MKLEIKNLQSSATYQVAKDTVLGREGSKADIVLRDQAVSKRHAKIYQMNGRWYLEDLASSNGTFLDNRRISEPVALSPGMVFALSENQFEVLQILNGKASAEIDTGTLDAPAGLEDLPSPVLRDGKLVRGSRGRSGPAPRPATVEVPTAAPPPPPSQSSAQRTKPEELDRSEAEALKPSNAILFFSSIPRAILYYLITVPLLAINPLGTVRKSIRDPILGPLEPIRLVAYGLPIGAFLAALGVLSTLGTTVLSASFSVPMDALGIAMVGGIAASLLTGFLAHPLLTAIVDRGLKGASDEKGRSNYVVLSQAALVLLAVPAATVQLVHQIQVPYIHVLPPLMTMYAALVMFYVWFAWWRHFEVLPAFLKMMKGLGVLIFLGSGWGVVQAGIASLPQGASPPEAAAPRHEPSAAPPPSEKRGPHEGAALAAVVPSTPTARTEPATPTPTPPASEAKAAVGATPVPPPVEAPKPAEEKVEAKAPPRPLDPPPATSQKTAEPAPEVEAPRSTPKKGPSPDFQSFIERRKAVEEAIEKDPTLLKRKDLQELYSAYLKKTFEIRRDWAGKKKLPDPALQKLNDRLKDVDVFEQTRKLVDDLYAKIF